MASISYPGPAKTAAFFFPFDCFGSAGTARGAELLADAVREMLADNRREFMPSRCHSYTPYIQVRETAFPTEKKIANWRAQGRAFIKKAFAGSRKLVWITGNHLGALPLYDELVSRAEGTLVLQFDAHLDIFNLADCEPYPNHGNFLMHVTGQLPPVINIGSRDLMLPVKHVEQYYQNVFCAAQVARDASAVLAAVVRAAKKARRIVIDLDCDVFDPAFFPAVLNPMPMGLKPSFLLKILQEIDPRRVEVVALSEFAPSKDISDQGLGTILWLLEWLFLSWYETPPGPIKM